MREDGVSVMLGTPRAFQKSLRMSSDDHWASTLVTKARKRHPLVTQAVSARIDQLLQGQLSERQLPSTELKSVAGALIADMVPVSSKAKE